MKLYKSYVPFFPSQLPLNNIEMWKLLFLMILLFLDKSCFSLGLFLLLETINE